MNSLVERLRVIAKAISAEDWRELSMRVPAESGRDADLVVMRSADLIEQQAERIKELEATLDRLYRVGHCGSVDSFLSCDDEVKRGYFAMMIDESVDNKKLRERVAELEAWRDSWVKCPEGAAAQRIKELEDDLSEWRIACEQKHEMLEAARVERQCWQRQLLSTQQELAALHKRIADAPVVAWANKDRGLISAWEKAHYTEMKALGSPGGERWLKGEDAERHTIPLISKEDLK